MPFKTFEELHKSIEEKIKKGTEKTCNIIFDLSQAHVPVRSGKLKNSGKIDISQWGSNGVITIQYNANYASSVEFGKKGTPITGVQEIDIPEYTTKKGVVVKSHKRRYTNKKVVEIILPDGSTIYRTVGSIGGYKGRFFLTNAVNEGLESLSGSIEGHLKDLEVI